MKKSVIVIVVAIALLSVILVAFTGATYSIIDNQTVYVNRILLDSQSLKDPRDGSKYIYAVYDRETYLAENPDDEDAFVISHEENTWMDYLIRIFDYNYFYDYLGNSLKLEAHALPDEATNKSLRFSGREKDEVYATVSAEGEVKYQSRLDEIAVIDINIAAKDGSKIECNVRIQSWMYIV